MDPSSNQQENQIGKVSPADEKFQELVQLGFPAELFWSPSGERHTPHQIQEIVEEWSQRQALLGTGGSVEDPSNRPPCHQIVRTREISQEQTPEQSPERKRQRQGESKVMEADLGAAASPIMDEDSSGAETAHDESEPWEEDSGENVLNRVFEQLQVLSTRLIDFDHRLQSLEASPQHLHIATSIEEARKQAADHLVEQAAANAAEITERTSSILQAAQTKYDAHFNELFHQHMEQIKNIFERGSGGIHTRIDGLHLEVQNFLGAVQGQDNARRVLESAVQDLCRNMNTQNLAVVQQVQQVGQQALRLTQQLQLLENAKSRLQPILGKEFWKMT